MKKVGENVMRKSISKEEDAKGPLRGARRSRKAMES